jgi:hypothetical protein
MLIVINNQFFKLPPVDEADMSVDAVKRRLASALSRKLHEE